jgi:hypothetical protein
VYNRNMSDAYRTGAVELHKDALVQMAIQWSSVRPFDRAVALVAEGDVHEAEIWRKAEEEYLVRGDDGSVAMLVDRERAKLYLVGANAKGLEYLIDEGDGLKRELPIVHVAKPGFRIEGLKYAAPSQQ